MTVNVLDIRSSLTLLQTTVNHDGNTIILESQLVGSSYRRLADAVTCNG